MSLTKVVEQKIQNIEMDKFFEKSRAEWIAAAKKTYSYLRESWGATADIRHDDVAKILKETLEANEKLQNFLAEKRQGQQYWFRYFADFILDRGWNEIHK
jgi:hypothetical protein